MLAVITDSAAGPCDGGSLGDLRMRIRKELRRDEEKAGEVMTERLCSRRP